MTLFAPRLLALQLVLSALFGLSVAAQNPPPGADQPPPPPPGFDGPPPFGLGGPPGGGFRGMLREETKLVNQFDKDGDKRLNTAERKEAREFLKKKQQEGGDQPRFGGPGRFGRRGPAREPGKPGETLTPKDVESFPNAPFYDPATLRTIFIEFENADWETELSDFRNTDVEVPAKLTVDGKVYPDAGIHFRGASSYGMVSEGLKRSLNVSVDFANKDQSIGGYRTLNLLNVHEDPSYLRTILYLQIAREYLPAPRANFVRVVINNENWGIYVNLQQFNKDFVQEWFDTTRGARWKVPGSPNGQGNLAYLGDDPAAYKKFYDIKSRDDEKSWNDLIQLCKILNKTAPDKLVAALEPVLDIEGALRFLALENALINNDGYWVRTSDYSIYQDEKGRFHILPYDANETFAVPGGPGFGGPRRGFGRPGGPAGAGAPPAAAPAAGGPPRDNAINGVELDPLIAAKDDTKPLISKLLAVPALRQRYLALVQEIADKWLDWNKLGPIATKYQDLIAKDVARETRKLESTESFEKSLTGELAREGGFGPPRIALKAFADQRRAYLLNYKEKKE